MSFPLQFASCAERRASCLLAAATPLLPPAPALAYQSCASQHPVRRSHCSAAPSPSSSPSARRRALRDRDATAP
ncbi:O-methyltransferase aurJ [Frankliniella fusca]|uniref:O-methyltransferase aurJ n=1 Tax=Frankliniella fusca TaxID=407009 RepID=A0AAE1LDP4_9NEOP|nr:O-methyltransferase aurJ [Frankliniella fusca]